MVLSIEKNEMHALSPGTLTLRVPKIFRKLYLRMAPDLCPAASPYLVGVYSKHNGI